MRMRRGGLCDSRFRLAAALCLLGGFFVSGLAAQDRPLQTPDAETVPQGTLRAQVGFDFLQDADFPLSGLSGDVSAVGVTDLRLGVGRVVEVELQGVVQNFLQVKREVPGPVTPDLTGPDSTHDIGDFSLWTKVRILSESGKRPALAFRFGYQMPNSDQARGIGTNSTNVFAEVILEKHLRQLKVFGDLGLGILEAPNAKFSQNDVLLYGGAFVYPLHRRLNLAGEVAGRYSSRTLTPALYGTESHSQARLGFQIFAGGFQWDVAAIAGVAQHDPTTGFTFGVSRDIRLFQPANH
jgi:hypothetical protein